MADTSENIRISTLFQKIESYFAGKLEVYPVDTTTASTSSSGNDKLIEDITLCTTLVDKYGLFSKNEDIDDYPTLSIKYLALGYYLAKAQSQTSDLQTRYNYLRIAKSEYEAFIQRCIRCNLAKPDEIGYDEDEEYDEQINPDAKRKRKIELFKKNRDTQRRMQELQRLLSSTGKSINSEEILIEHEDEVRELAIIQLKSYLMEAVNDIPMITQEMQLLRHRADLEDDPILEARYMDERPKPGDGPGLSVTRIDKVGDQLITTREQVKANVFIPRMEGPSISLEEYGDMVKAEAMAAKNAPAEDGGVRRYKQLVEAGEEEDEQLVDEATMADRDWDAFKEANPRGWGNKANKRY